MCFYISCVFISMSGYASVTICISSYNRYRKPQEFDQVRTVLYTNGLTTKQFWDIINLLRGFKFRQSFTMTVETFY